MDDPDDFAAEVLRSGGWAPRLRTFSKTFSFIFTLQEVEAGLVELVPVDDALRREWPELPSWRRVGQYANMEVQSRQILNNEHALQRAKQ